MLNAATTSLVIALVTITYGIRWERHYTAWISVVMNLVFTVITLGSVDLPTEMVIILLLYIMLGLITASYDINEFYVLFGTKTFGSLEFVIAIISGFSLQVDFVGYLLAWFIVGVIVYLLGYYE